MLRDVLDFQQDPRALAAKDYLGHGAVEYAVNAPRSRPRELALYDSFAAPAHTLEHRQQALGAARQFSDRSTQRLIAPESQQALRRGVQIRNAQILIQQENARHHGVEQLGAVASQQVHLQLSRQAEHPLGAN